ncbi:MAG: MBL fold metallo-hydrolase [Syntrophales bacterium]
MTLLNRQWQTVPGTGSARIYPYFRKPDLLSANTFLIQTPEQITLIDPGAMEEQSREMEAIVRGLFLDKPRPVLVYLTHCHIDHALHVPRYLAMRDRIPVWTAVHHDAVEAIVAGDPKRTIAELYGWDYPCFSPDISLLPPHVRSSLSAREIHLPDRSRISIETVQLETAIAAPFYRKRLPQELFSTIAGRLYYLAHHLEDLGEEELARHYRQCLDADKIDECLLNLRLLAEDLRAGRKLEVEFAHRALGIVQKVRALFDQKILRAVIPVSLLQRADLLLMDFINATKGLRNLEEIVAADLNRLIEEIISGLKRSPREDDAILEAAEDEERFLSALASRIAYLPLFEDVRIAFRRQEDLPLLRIAASRFSDTLTDFLGLLAARECREISLAAAGEDGHGELQIMCPGKNIGDVVGETKGNSFARRFGMCGLRLSLQGERMHLKSD